MELVFCLKTRFALQEVTDSTDNPEQDFVQLLSSHRVALQLLSVNVVTYIRNDNSIDRQSIWSECVLHCILLPTGVAQVSMVY